jgi:hypothetical protein
VYSLAAHGASFAVSELAYLQYIRSGILKATSPTGRAEDAPVAICYLANVSRFASALADQVAVGLGGDVPDAIVELPSTCDFNKPYTTALVRRFPTAVNLSAHLSRLRNVKAGEGASFADVLADTIIDGSLSLHGIKSVLLIDDVLEGGKTSGAVITRLRERGLPTTSRIILAVPLVAFRS